MVKKVLVFLLLFIILFILSNRSNALSVHDFPEHLKNITYSHDDNPESLRFWGMDVLGLSHPNGKITIYVENIIKHGVSLEDVILHEIGHQEYWSIGWMDPHKNSCELANKFVIEAKKAKTKRELYYAMGYWRIVKR